MLPLSPRAHLARHFSLLPPGFPCCNALVMTLHITGMTSKKHTAQPDKL